MAENPGKIEYFDFHEKNKIPENRQLVNIEDEERAIYELQKYLNERDVKALDRKSSVYYDDFRSQVKLNRFRAIAGQAKTSIYFVSHRFFEKFKPENDKEKIYMGLIAQSMINCDYQIMKYYRYMGYMRQNSFRKIVKILYKFLKNDTKTVEIAMIRNELIIGDKLKYEKEIPIILQELKNVDLIQIDENKNAYIGGYYQPTMMPLYCSLLYHFKEWDIRSLNYQNILEEGILEYWFIDNDYLRKIFDEMERADILNHAKVATLDEYSFKHHAFKYNFYLNLIKNGRI